MPISWYHPICPDQDRDHSQALTVPTARPYLKRVATIERAGHAVNAYVSCCAMSPLLPSGRVLQGEFTDGAGFHDHRLSEAYPLLLPFNALQNLVVNR